MAIPTIVQKQPILTEVPKPFLTMTVYEYLKLNETCGCKKRKEGMHKYIGCCSCSYK
jgi:hypothetical protein